MRIRPWKMVASQDGRNLSTKLEHSPWTVNLQESRLLWPLESRAEQGFLWHCWGHSQGLGWSPCHLSTQTLHMLYTSHSIEKCPSSSYPVKWFTCTKIVEPGQSALDDNYIGVTSKCRDYSPMSTYGAKNLIELKHSSKSFEFCKLYATLSINL